MIADMNIILEFKRAPLSEKVQVCFPKVQPLWQFRVQTWTIIIFLLCVCIAYHLKMIVYL